MNGMNWSRNVDMLIIFFAKVGEHGVEGEEV